MYLRQYDILTSIYVILVFCERDQLSILNMPGMLGLLGTSIRCQLWCKISIAHLPLRGNDWDIRYVNIEFATKYDPISFTIITGQGILLQNSISIRAWIINYIHRTVVMFVSTAVEVKAWVSNYLFVPDPRETITLKSPGVSIKQRRKVHRVKPLLFFISLNFGGLRAV